MRKSKEYKSHLEEANQEKKGLKSYLKFGGAFRVLKKSKAEVSVNKVSLQHEAFSVRCSTPREIDLNKKIYISENNSPPTYFSRSEELRNHANSPEISPTMHLSTVLHSEEILLPSQRQLLKRFHDDS